MNRFSAGLPILLLLCSLFVAAPPAAARSAGDRPDLAKGSRLLGAEFMFYTMTRDLEYHSDSTFIHVSDSRDTQFLIRLHHGTFYAPRWASGPEVQINARTHTVYSHPWSMDIFLGAWSRYYLYTFRDIAAFYPEIAVGYEWQTRWDVGVWQNEMEYSFHGLGYRFGGGVGFFLTERVSLDMTLRYHFARLHGAVTFDSEYEARRDVDEFEAMFGIDFFFGPNDKGERER
ncbi:hypothetical protein GF324_13920 [bacterium]|nr:hypothetical protein [bacterium]